jgi:hypothetical protein
MKWLIKTFLNVLQLAALYIAFYYAMKFCEGKTDGFTLLRISSSLPYNKRWETQMPSRNEQILIQQALSQTFTYLGSGGQCYAFVSDDGNYVIKFFKHHLRTGHLWMDFLPLPSRLQEALQKKKQKRLNKLLRDFDSYKIAYENLKEETGILYVHLNKSTDLKQQVQIIDKIGIRHRVDLDRTEFIVQKKASLIHARLDELMKQNDLSAAKEIFHSLVQVIVDRCKKGIFDEDAKIHRNFGCIGNNVIVIDVGRFRKDPTRVQPDIYKQDVRSITARFRAWLKHQYPVLVETFDQQLLEVCSHEEKTL